MDTVKIIHTADLHLGSTKTGVKLGKTEIENTFFRIINYCKTENVDFLLIAGDLFDSPYIDAKSAGKIFSAMEQIPETIIAISAGNHDPACPGSVYQKCSMPKNVYVFRSLAEHFDFPQKNVCLWGAGFAERFENASLMQGFDLKDSSAINLCVLHGDLVSNGASSVYNPITESQIERSNFDYLALGHIHKRSDIKKIGQTFFAYSGCPDATGFDELGSHGIYIGEVGKNLCNLEYREISSRQYILDEVDICECKNSFDIADSILTHLKEKYGENFDHNLYRINLIGTVPAETSIEPLQVETILNETVEYIKINDCTETDISDIQKLASDTSLKGIFVSKLLERLDGADTESQHILKGALSLGLKAFSKGVKLDDN